MLPHFLSEPARHLEPIFKGATLYASFRRCNRNEKSQKTLPAHRPADWIFNGSHSNQRQAHRDHVRMFKAQFLEKPL